MGTTAGGVHRPRRASEGEMATTASAMPATAPARTSARPHDWRRRSVPRPRASASSPSIARRHRLVTRAGSLFEVATPVRTTTELDERDAFKRLMERAGVKHRVRLASGARGRGLFPSGPVGWGKSAVLLSVPLDVCIVAPFGDAAAAAGAGGVSAAVAEELGFSKDPPEKAKKDTYGILRAAWEKRAGVTLPETITSLSRSGDGADRELAVALWVLFATRSGDAERNVWRAYAEWLPTAEELPSLMLANDKELDQLQDEALKREAKATQNAADKLFLDGIKKNTKETDGSASDFFVIRDGLEITAEDARWAFALVASRALASPVGDDGSSDFAAILTPFFDMANSDDVSLVSASKSVRGTADADVENAARVVIERGLNQGVGGPRVVLETTRGLESADAEILISYDPTASNAELMLRYGFSLRGNRNERLPGSSGSIHKDAKTATTRQTRLESEILRFALEETGLMTEETSAEERRRLFVAVASACGGFGNPEEDQGEWELDDAQVRLEIACAEAFVDAWTKQLRSFDTDLAQDEAALTAAQTGSLPGATPRIVAAIEYRAERKRCLETGVRALRAYVEWLQEEEEEEESAGGFVDQQE